MCGDETSAAMKGLDDFESVGKKDVRTTRGADQNLRVRQNAAIHRHRSPCAVPSPVSLQLREMAETSTGVRARRAQSARKNSNTVFNLPALTFVVFEQVAVASRGVDDHEIEDSEENQDKRQCTELCWGS